MTPRKRAAYILTAAVTVTLISAVGARAEFLGTDAFDELTGQTRTAGPGSLIDKYPLSAYQLDYDVDNGVTGLGGFAQETSQWIAATMANCTFFFMFCVIRLLTWAFTLDFLTGPNGALRPMSDALRQLYNTTFGDSALRVMISVAGIWAIAQVVQRRHARMMSGLATSVIFAVIGMFFVFTPEKTVSGVLDATTQLKLSLLSGAQLGTAGDPEQALRTTEDHLTEAFILKPWAILEFGKLKHCVDTDDKDPDGFPRPVSALSSKRDVCRDHLTVGKDGYGGYAPRFLRQPAGSKTRHAEYEALKNGQVGDSPQFAGYVLDKSDAPAADLMQAGGAAQRLLLAILVCGAVWGAILLIGWLSTVVVMSSVYLLVFIVFSIGAMLAALYPGAGHAVFKWWLAKVAGYAVAPVLVAFVLAVLIPVVLAFLAATATLGAVLALGLVGLFCWGAFLKRNVLLNSLAQATRTSFKHNNPVTELADKAFGAMSHPVGVFAGSFAGGVAADRYEEHHSQTERETRAQPQPAAPEAPAWRDNEAEYEVLPAPAHVEHVAPEPALIEGSAVPSPPPATVEPGPPDAPPMTEPEGWPAAAGPAAAGDFRDDLERERERSGAPAAPAVEPVVEPVEPAELPPYEFQPRETPYEAEPPGTFEDALRRTRERQAFEPDPEYR